GVPLVCGPAVHGWPLTLPLAVLLVASGALAFRVTRARASRDLLFALAAGLTASLLINDATGFMLAGGIACASAVARFAPSGAPVRLPGPPRPRPAPAAAEQPRRRALSFRSLRCRRGRPPPSARPFGGTSGPRARFPPAAGVAAAAAGRVRLALGRGGRRGLTEHGVDHGDVAGAADDHVPERVREARPAEPAVNSAARPELHPGELHELPRRE